MSDIFDKDALERIIRSDGDDEAWQEGDDDGEDHDPNPRSKKKRASFVPVDYFANEKNFKHMRKALDEFPRSNMSNKDFAKQRGINDSTFNRHRRDGFPSSWEESQQQRRGSGKWQQKPGEGEKMDVFVKNNLDYENNAALNEAFKIDFPEITDSTKRGSRLQKIRKNIAKIKAERDALNAAAAAVSANIDSGDESSDDEDAEFL